MYDMPECIFQTLRLCRGYSVDVMTKVLMYLVVEISPEISLLTDLSLIPLLPREAILVAPGEQNTFPTFDCSLRVLCLALHNNNMNTLDTN